MPVKISEYTLAMYGVDKLSAPVEQARKTIERTEKTVDNFAGRLAAMRREAAASGELGAERLFRNPERLLGMITGQGLQLAVANFAFRGLAEAADQAAEHIKKVREGTEGVVEAVMNVAKTVPVLGEAVKAGMSIGQLITGQTDPEEDLKHILEEQKQRDERAKYITDEAARSRMLYLGSFDKQRAEVEEKYKNLGGNRDTKRSDAINAAARDYEAATQRMRDDLAGLQSFAREGSPMSADDQARMSTLETDIARRETPEAMRQVRRQASEKYDAIEKQQAKDKAKELAEIDRQAGEVRAGVERQAEMHLRTAREAGQEESLRRAGQFYAADRIQLTREYDKTIQDINDRVEKQKHDNPAMAKDFEAAAAKDRQAAKADLDRNLAKSQLDQQKEDAHKALDTAKAKNDAESALRVERLRQLGRDTDAEREVLRHTRQTAEAEAKLHRDDALRGLGDTKADREQRARIEQDYANQVQAARAAEAAGNARLDKDVADKQREIGDLLAKAEVAHLTHDPRNRVAAIKAEVHEQFREEREELDKLIKDPNATAAQKQQAKAMEDNLAKDENAEMEQRLAALNQHKLNPSLVEGLGVSGAAIAGRERMQKEQYEFNEALIASGQAGNVLGRVGGGGSRNHPQKIDSGDVAKGMGATNALLQKIAESLVNLPNPRI